MTQTDVLFSVFIVAECFNRHSVQSDVDKLFRTLKPLTTMDTMSGLSRVELKAV